MIVDLQVNLETPTGAPADPELLVQSAKKAGLDGLLITTAGNIIPDVAMIRRAGEAHGVAVFRGAKIASNHGLLLCILPDPEVELSAGWAEATDGVFDANSVIDAIEDRGGVTVALRPYDRELALPMGDHLFSLQGISACEVQNGRLTEEANDLALEAASNLEMPCVGTSDAAGADGIGTAATLFRTRLGSEAELCDAIRQGECWPVTFSSELPAMDTPSIGGRPSNDARGRRGRRGGGGRGGRSDRPPQQGAGAGREGAGVGAGGGQRRDRQGSAGGGGSFEARDGRGGRGRRRRGGGGPGGGGGGPGGGSRGRGGPGRPGVYVPPDGYGNGRPGARPGEGRGEDFGNVLKPDDQHRPSEDIGNRLRPGERSPYTPVSRFIDDDDDESGA